MRNITCVIHEGNSRNWHIGIVALEKTKGLHRRDGIQDPRYSVNNDLKKEQEGSKVFPY